MESLGIPFTSPTGSGHEWRMLKLLSGFHLILPCESSLSNLNTREYICLLLGVLSFPLWERKRLSANPAGGLSVHIR